MPASGGKSSTQTFVIRVTDENDAPTISTTPLNINEPLRTNASFDLSQYASDEDNQSGAGGDLLSWTEISGDTTVFALDQNGTLRFNQDSDYDPPRNVYTIGVKVEDGRVDLPMPISRSALIKWTKHPSFSKATVRT